MKQLSIATLILLLVLASSVSAYGKVISENITVPRHTMSYKLIARDGKLYQVKCVENISFLANRLDGMAMAFTPYNDFLKIDKASAPKAKAEYMQWIDEDIFYDDSRVCFMNIPLSKGKVAKAVFETTLSWPEQFCNIPFYVSYPTDEISVNIEVPAQLVGRYSFEPRNMPDDAVIDSITAADGSLSYSITLHNRAPYHSEKLGPSKHRLVPEIYVHGHFADIGELYNYFASKTDGAGITDDDISGLTRRITASCSSDLERIDTIAAWVRDNIRYVAVTHGEYGVRPAPAAEVLAKRFGDCKGTASLLKAMMTSAGIDGRLVWIGTEGDVAHDWTQLPALSSGNHMIAAAVLPDSIIYVDGTTTYSPRGYYPPSIRGQQVIIEGKGSPLVARVPSVHDAADVDTLEANFHLDGDALVSSVSHRLGGIFRMRAADLYLGSDNAKRNDVLGRYLCRYKKNVKFSDVVFSAPATDSHQATVCATLIDPTGAKTIGDAVYVELYPLRVDYAVPVEMQERTVGLHLPFKENLYSRLTLDIPEGFTPVIPAPVEISNQWFDASIVYTVTTNGALLCEGRLIVKKRDVDFDMLNQWNAATKQLSNACRARLRLNSL